jgi:hypothetical protein
MGTLEDMPFNTLDAEVDLFKINLEKILTTFKKPWKKNSFDMNLFSLSQETFQGHHQNYIGVYNDGIYTIRLLYGVLPIASIGAVVEDNFIGISQIQGTQYEEIADARCKYIHSNERNQIKDILQSFYWSHALLTIATNHFFDLGVEDLRVVSFDYNPNRRLRGDVLDSAIKINSAYVTYDLTALTLGFTPMLPKNCVAEPGLTFGKDGHPDKKVMLYCFDKDNYKGSVIDNLTNRSIEENKFILKNIHSNLGNYRQKELIFDVNITNYESSMKPALTEEPFKAFLF